MNNRKSVYYDSENEEWVFTNNEFTKYGNNETIDKWICLYNKKLNLSRNMKLNIFPLLLFFCISIFLLVYTK